MAQAASAAFFDLDKTIIATSSSFVFSRPFAKGGLLSRRAMLRSAYAHFLFHLGGADHDQMEKLRDMLSRMCAGWEVDTVRGIVNDTLNEVVPPVVYAEALRLIAEHKAEGRTVVIVSTSGTEVVEPIGQLLGADQVIATRLEVRDGRYTGTVEYYCYGPEKARAIVELAAEQGWDLAQCYAYSDSMTDAPMLAAVGHPMAVNPDKELRKYAAAQGWPAIDFERPVALRSAVPTPTRNQTLAALAVGTAVAGGYAWARARRSTRVT